MMIRSVEPEPARLVALSLRSLTGAHGLMPSQHRFLPDGGPWGVLTSEGRSSLFDRSKRPGPHQRKIPRRNMSRNRFPVRFHVSNG